jgi:hypothetical protein
LALVVVAKDVYFLEERHNFFPAFHQ